jgi:hypothetical protein
MFWPEENKIANPTPLSFPFRFNFHPLPFFFPVGPFFLVHSFPTNILCCAATFVKGTLMYGINKWIVSRD